MWFKLTRYQCWPWPHEELDEKMAKIHTSPSAPCEVRFMNNKLVPSIVPVRLANTYAFSTTTMSPSVRTPFVSPIVTQRSQPYGIFISAQEGGS